MLKPSQWLFVVILPFLLVIGLDQGTKSLASLYLQEPATYGYLILRLFHNFGLMLGSQNDASKFLTVVLPSTLGAFTIYSFVVIQYFLPIRSLAMRLGLTIFVAGVTGNIIDRLRFGYVVDFINITTPYFKTGIFNIADALQWVGLGGFFASYFANGRLLYPRDDRRNRKWIDQSFQLRYCLTLVATGLMFALISGALSYSFLNVVLTQVVVTDAATVKPILQNFLAVYSIAAAVFFVTLFIIGVILSHRIIGPVRGFENFLKDLMQGKNRNFKLRDHDEFGHLEELADSFQLFFIENFKVAPKALETAQKAPSLRGKTYDDKTIDLRAYLGKKIWLIFYRYATCPLCVMHLDEIHEQILRVKANGAEVIAVFDSRADQFIKEDTGATGELLKSMDIPLVADPDRVFYRRFGTQKSVLALFRFAVFKRLFDARKKNYLQGSIDGDLGHLPAHFLIDQFGYVAKSYYGKHQVDHPPAEWVDSFIA